MNDKIKICVVRTDQARDYHIYPGGETPPPLGYFAIREPGGELAIRNGNGEIEALYARGAWQSVYRVRGAAE